MHGRVGGDEVEMGVGNESAVDVYGSAGDRRRRFRGSGGLLRRRYDAREECGDAEQRRTDSAVGRNGFGDQRTASLSDLLT